MYSALGIQTSIVEVVHESAHIFGLIVVCEGRESPPTSKFTTPHDDIIRTGSWEEEHSWVRVTELVVVVQS